MLYWHFRNFQCIISALFKPKASPKETLVKTFWANPFDSDWLSSVQAGRFFTYTDAARWEIAVRLGFLKLALRKKLVVILGGQKIIYRRPVKIFRRFRLSMRIVGWDERWMYAAHYFEQSGKIRCVSFAKIGLRSKDGLYSPITAFTEMGCSKIAPSNWILKHFQEDLETLEIVEKALKSG